MALFALRMIMSIISLGRRCKSNHNVHQQFLLLQLDTKNIIFSEDAENMAMMKGKHKINEFTPLVNT